MDNKKIILFAALGVLACLAAGSVLIFKTEPAPQPSKSERPIGALSGPDIPSPYLNWGGIVRYSGAMSLNTATTTPCAIQSPAATSTLTLTALRISTATSTATTWNVAKATTAFATTTQLRDPITLGSGVQGTMLHVASTTSLGLEGVEVLAPNTWIVWGVAGVRPADTTKLNGFCQAEFYVI